MIRFKKDPFLSSLEKDPSLKNTPRNVPLGFYSLVKPKQTKQPQFIHINEVLLDTLAQQEDKNPEALLKLLSGNYVPSQITPYAMNYGGHQFGHWAGQLGDGRAIHLGAVPKQIQNNSPSDFYQPEGVQETLWQLQLKGAGPTPYSRNADGLAVLRSSIREYLCSEAMYALGVPTTRALSLSLTGDQVLRDVLYNGNAAYEPGAIVARMAPNFIRFGSFELPATRGQKEALKNLTEATIKYHFPEIKTAGKAAYLALFKEVCERTAALVVHWQGVGFVHGVLNTDNMSILGLTLDYGPYGWLESYDPQWTPNTTDAEHRRYCFGNQSQVGLWNLYQLANALYPLIEETAALEESLSYYKTQYENGYTRMMCQKLGIIEAINTKQKTRQSQLIEDLESVLCLTETDMTIFFRQLASFNPHEFLKTSPESPSEKVFGPLLMAFYKPEMLQENILAKWQEWLKDYASFLNSQNQDPKKRAAQMNAVNPKYVLRNYMAQMAIEKAEKGDYTLLTTLFKLLQKPYEEQPLQEEWFAKRPEWARNKVGSSVLSCSS